MIRVNCHHERQLELCGPLDGEGFLFDGGIVLLGKG